MVIYMNFFKLFFLIFLSSSMFAQVVKVDSNSKSTDLLSKSSIYIDEQRVLNINEVIKKDNDLFKENKEDILTFGYSPNIDVWIKFTLTNISDKPILKTVEYAHPLTSDVQFFNPNKDYEKMQDGLLNTPQSRKTINPSFQIILQPNETNTYYIKASSFITTLIVKLKLWDNEAFYKKEIEHQVILALFFGAMFVLGVYNLFIFFFTRQKSYFFYVMYIFGIIFHQIFYVGVGNIYLFDKFQMISFIENASVIVAFPIFALALFTKSFLPLKTTKWLNRILNFLLLSIIVYLSLFLVWDELNKYRNLLSIILLCYLIFITIYFTFKRNRQAYFILFGWLIMFTAIILMFLSSLGIFNIYAHFPYLIEIALISEAVIFSIALADRINSLQKEKNEVNRKLIQREQTEKQRLTKQVEEKTKDLKEALGEKNVLLKELNHRVKNNMQTIVSLIRLQGDDIEDEKSKEVLETIQNRITAMSHLHELLYTQDNVSHINTYEYFDLLVEEVKGSYEDIDIHLNIQTNLRIEDAIYCGLILNELITNSFKYAFPENHGNVYIDLEKANNQITLNVKDDGIGFDNSKEFSSLGLILVDTLARNQLKGEIKIDTSNGVSTHISWSEDEN